MTQQDKNTILEIYNYLNNLHREYEAELAVLNNEAERIKGMIEYNESCISRIESSIDIPYMTVSASTVASSAEKAEIESFKSIIEDKIHDMTHLDEQKRSVENKISELNILLSDVRRLLGKGETNAD